MRGIGSTAMTNSGDRAWAVTTLVEASDILTSEAEARLATLGISLAEKEVLFRLSLAAGRLRMSDLSAALLFSPSGTTRLIDRMEERNLVERGMVEGDRRSTSVRITKEGLDVLRRSAPIMEGVVRDVLASHVSDDEVDTLTKILERIVIGNGRWQQRDAGEDFASAIKSSGQPSMKTR